MLSSDISTPPVGGVREDTPPPLRHSVFFLFLNVFSCTFGIHACLHPPKHLSIPPQFQIPRNNPDAKSETCILQKNWKYQNCKIRQLKIKNVPDEHN